jgi:REP element-mobilizing transposase RayT
LAIPDFNPGVELDEWVVMPNHAHGIVVLVGEEGVFSNAPTIRANRQRMADH